MIHVPEKRYRFSLSVDQTELVQDSLILGAFVGRPTLTQLKVAMNHRCTVVISMPF